MGGIAAEFDMATRYPHPASSKRQSIHPHEAANERAWARPMILKRSGGEFFGMAHKQGEQTRFKQGGHTGFKQGRTHRSAPTV